jgi:hypothetical protein
LSQDIVTEGDQFSIEEFIPLLRERMNVLNPFVRQFLVGWITVLDSVPDIDMLGFLPDFLDGKASGLSRLIIGKKEFTCGVPLLAGTIRVLEGKPMHF